MLTGAFYHIPFLSAIIKKLFGIVHKKLFNISRIVPSFSLKSGTTFFAKNN